MYVSSYRKLIVNKFRHYGVISQYDILLCAPLVLLFPVDDTQGRPVRKSRLSPDPFALPFFSQRTIIKNFGMA